MASRTGLIQLAIRRMANWTRSMVSWMWFIHLAIRRVGCGSSISPSGELDVVHLTHHQASWTRSIKLEVVCMLMRSLFESFLLRFFLKLFLESFLKRSNLGRWYRDYRFWLQQLAPQLTSFKHDSCGRLMFLIEIYGHRYFYFFLESFVDYLIAENSLIIIFLW